MFGTPCRAGASVRPKLIPPFLTWCTAQSIWPSQVVHRGRRAASSGLPSEDGSSCFSHTLASGMYRSLDSSGSPHTTLPWQLPPARQGGKCQDCLPPQAIPPRPCSGTAASSTTVQRRLSEQLPDLTTSTREITCSGSRFCHFPFGILLRHARAVC